MPVTDERGNYVVGFLFSRTCERVVLIRKDHPEWQAGRLNGVGGRMEPGEDAQHAMEREFREEAGMYVPWTRWKQFAVLHCQEKWDVFCMCAYVGDDLKIGDATTQTSEPVRAFSLDELGFHKCVPNTDWLIRLALCEEQPEKVEVYYQNE